MHYPSCRELAKRFGVSHSLIIRFAREHDCHTRREYQQAKVLDLVAQNLSERHAQTLTDARSQTLATIDAFLLSFGELVQNKGLQCKSAGDFNLMARLREFLVGGADQRNEIKGSINLTILQIRYLSWVQSVAEQSNEAADAPSLAQDLEQVERLSRSKPTSPSNVQPISVGVSPGPQIALNQIPNTDERGMPRPTLDRNDAPDPELSVRRARDTHRP